MHGSGGEGIDDEATVGKHPRDIRISPWCTRVLAVVLPRSVRENDYFGCMDFVTFTYSSKVLG